MNSESGVPSEGKKVHIEPDSAAHRALQSFIEAAERLATVTKTLPADVLTFSVDQDMPRWFPKLIPQRLAVIAAMQAAEDKTDYTFYLRDMTTAILAEVLHQASRKGNRLNDLSRTMNRSKCTLSAHRVYNMLRGGGRLKIPEGCPSNLQKAVETWEQRRMELKQSLEGGDGVSEYDFSEIKEKIRHCRTLSLNLAPFPETNTLREALKQLTQDFTQGLTQNTHDAQDPMHNLAHVEESWLPSLPQEDAQVTLHRPPDAWWVTAEKFSESYFKGDTATKFNTQLAQLKSGWGEEKGKTSRNGELINKTKALFNTAYTWPDELGLTLAELTDLHADRLSTYPTRKADA